MNENQAPKIVKTELKISGKLAFLLENVVPPDFCEKLIQLSEKEGYKQATLNVEPGIEIQNMDARNNYRYMRDDFEVSGHLFNLVKEYLPKEWGSNSKVERKLISLNERLRFLRYEPGQKFERHFDGWYARKNGERSFLTLQLYLNEGFEGGETTFFLDDDDDTKRIAVKPKTGMVLIFQHDILHEGTKITKGTKYVIRTDVMYTGKLLI
eukprot:TRINITY_DN3890_c0_g1_i1.p1 TRINITY_DN3890_c0_g1~~TRINITY_DN3890_c0_g1_i1.p1  ORF type:complete len:210 (+),score=49.67 TRINITY_DN3890_c0_g1_i1:215-844(+)